MVGWLKFNIIEKIPFMVYLEIQCITFKMEKSFIAHPWIQRSVVGLEEYSAHDWRAATSGTARSSYLARVGPVGQPTPLSEYRIIYWLCDVTLVIKATTSASKTRVQLGPRQMIIKTLQARNNSNQSEIAYIISWDLFDR